METRIEKLRSEIAERQEELNKLEGAEPMNEKELDELTKRLTR